ncbi:MAG: family 10 glycosylhydrolase [Chitinophagaceae bacterium]
MNMMKSLFFFISFILPVLLPAQTPEFRGVWIATVDNIDWPQRGVTDPGRQQAEFIRQLDLHKKNGMNAVIVQVRPSADAFYPSDFEPWSQWLTGVQGRAPFPYYDPLAFMIREAHKRGMEFHAWLNPYRASFNSSVTSIAKNHITRTHPYWFVTYGGKKYFEPSNKEAQDFVVKVVRDIVRRYDIDAIHMDDYFYPYRVPGKEFPDAAAYLRSGTTLAKADWRRSNTDSIISKLSVAIKQEKSWVKFGISPFGVWRNITQDPDGSRTTAGTTNYDDLYADILLWLENKWIDYVVPQLYWEIGHRLADYRELVEWWSNHGFGRHVYIGHGIYRATEKNAAWKRRDELPEQIRLLRSFPGIHGSAYFSSRSFDSNPNGWNDSLRNNYYQYPVKVPVMEWLPDRGPMGSNKNNEPGKTVPKPAFTNDYEMHTE